MTSGRSLTSDATAGATVVETVAGLTIVGCALLSWADNALLFWSISPDTAEAVASAGFILTWFFMFCFTSKPVYCRGTYKVCARRKGLAAVHFDKVCSRAVLYIDKDICADVYHSCVSDTRCLRKR